MKQFFSNCSITARLILAVLTVEALSAVLVIVLAYGYEAHSHFAAFRVMLGGRADSILGAVQDSENAEDALILDTSDLRLPTETIWQVGEKDGSILGRSPNWSGPPSSSSEEWRDGYLRLALHRRHYAVLVVNGTRAVDPGTPTAKIHQLTVYCGAPVDPVWHAVRGAVEFYAAGSLLLLLITGPLIAWLLHRGLLPLRHLADLASQVSANTWQFEPPASARATPELAPITLAIESVLDRLEHAFNQQRAFVSDAAHELKTAVAVIKSSLQLLVLRPRSAPEYQAGLDRCLADSERLEELVARMLTLARLESDQPSQCVSLSAELRHCVERVAQHLEPLAQMRQVNVVRHIDCDVAVALDEEDCFTLVSNLLLNALQHSKPRSVIEVKLTASSEQAQLSFVDDGEGLDLAVLPHVFDRFYRGDPSRSRATGGSGLGLAICKAIVDRAGGSITLSNNPQGGATATVFLPLVNLLSLAKEVAK